MKRSSGILLHLTSLPSPYGIGNMGRAARDFIDFLRAAGQRYWQILPLGATSHDGAFDSPYQAYSAFAGNPYFISLDQLVEEGVLTQAECEGAQLQMQEGRVDYDAQYNRRLPLLRKAYERSGISQMTAYQKFIRENCWWLDDYALFMAARTYFNNQSWTQWPEDLRMHYGFALDYYREKLYYEVEFHKYLQFKFIEQWSALKKYANDKHIQIVGDIPIYVSPDGSDVWAHPEMFQLDEQNRPTQIAGCPPDSFCADGQVWGNPLYRWDYHKKTGYQWWVTRMWYSYQLYDVVRIDHFRGFDEYFSIPADTALAKDGHWEKGPGMELFNTLKAQLGEQGVVAEDLGLLTPSVRKLVKDSGFPNMKVLQFAFDPEDVGGANEYLPHNYNNNCWVYTGTHDNETLVGWLGGLTKAQREHIRDYLSDHDTPYKRMAGKMISLAMMSAAVTCIVPVQDWLGLDNSARMNMPGTVDINWGWRLLPEQLTEALAEHILVVSKRFGRANWDTLKAQSGEEQEQNEDTLAEDTE